MPVMGVGEVRMSMDHRLVPVPVDMWGNRFVRIMVMVMLVVLVDVFVF